MSKRIVNGLVILLCVTFLLASCGGNQAVFNPPTAISVAPTATPDLPNVKSVDLDRSELPRYESLELKVGIDAKYTNPYDAREVTLDGVFTGPDGKSMSVPGFWDGNDS
jgi:hypothetical protein